MDMMYNLCEVVDLFETRNDFGTGSLDYNTFKFTLVFTFSQIHFLSSYASNIKTPITIFKIISIVVFVKSLIPIVKLDVLVCHASQLLIVCAFVFSELQSWVVFSYTSG